MKTKIFALLVSVSYLSVGCRTASNNSKTKDLDFVDTSAIPSFRCETGDAFTFAMQRKPKIEADSRAQPAVPEVLYEASDFPAINGAPEEVENIRPDYHVIRLDGCNVNGEISITRVLFGGNDVVKLATPVGPSVYTGLGEVFFDQNYSNLDVRIPVEIIEETVKKENDGSKAKAVKTGEKTVYLVGSKDGKAALLTLVDIKGKDVSFASGIMNPFFVGQFVYEDVAKEKTCAERKTVAGSYTKGTFTMTWLGESGFGGGNGPINHPCQITITDSNPLLGKNAGKAVVLSDSDGSLAKNFVSGAGHHGICYWANITTPMAKYAFSSVKTDQDCPNLPYKEFKKWDTWQAIYGAKVVVGQGGYNFGNKVGESIRMPLEVK